MANDISFQCQHCGQSLEVEADGAGMIVKCPACNRDIEVPKPAPEQPSPVVKSSASDTAPLSSTMDKPGKSIKPVSDSVPMEKTTSDAPARRPVLFSIITATALTFSLITVVLLVITGIKYIRLAVPFSANIEYGEIMPSPANAAMEWKEMEKQLAPVVIKNISGKKTGGRRGSSGREPVFLSWVSGMDTSERKEFCRNLEAIVAEAERRSNDAWQVMNAYAKLKQAKLHELRLQEMSRRKSTRLKEIGLATAGLFVTAVLLALFAGVTILLAVEKNTRRLKDN